MLPGLIFFLRAEIRYLGLVCGLYIRKCYAMRIVNELKRNFNPPVIELIKFFLIDDYRSEIFIEVEW